MVFHDADLRRLCGTDARVAECDGDWLGGQCLLGTDETIPRLSELVAKWPAHLPLLIECKTLGNNAPELAGTVVAALSNDPRNAAIMSFDPTVARWLSEHHRDVIRGLVVDADWPPDFRAEAVVHARPQFLAVDIRLLGDPWTAGMRELMRVYSWTVRTPEQWTQAKVHADAAIWEGNGRP